MAHAQNLNESTMEYHKVESCIQHLLPPKDVQITTYADDITINAPYIKHSKAQQLIQPYLHMGMNGPQLIIFI